MIDYAGQSDGTKAEINYRLLHSQGGMGSGLFIRGRCHSRLLEVKLGLRSLAAKVSGGYWQMAYAEAV